MPPKTVFFSAGEHGCVLGAKKPAKGLGVPVFGIVNDVEKSVMWGILIGGP